MRHAEGGGGGGGDVLYLFQTGPVPDSRTADTTHTPNRAIISQIRRRFYTVRAQRMDGLRFREVLGKLRYVYAHVHLFPFPMRRLIVLPCCQWRAFTFHYAVTVRSIAELVSSVEWRWSVAMLMCTSETFPANV